MSRRTVVNPNGTFLGKNKNKEIKEKVLKKLSFNLKPDRLVNEIIDLTIQEKDAEFLKAVDKIIGKNDVRAIELKKELKEK